MNSKLLAAVCVLSMVACGDSGSGAGGSGGSGTTTTSKSASTGTKMATVASSSSTGTGGAGADGTSGDTCTDSTTCDVSGDGTAACSNKPVFNGGTLYPDAVCIQTAPCDLGDGTQIMTCDADTGVCLDVSDPNGGLCLPFCQFDDTGAAPTGKCPGKDACFPYGFGQDPNMNNMLFGVGYCFGGCLKDADCTATGEACDLGSGLCVTASSITPPTKMVGDACTAMDTACNCSITSTMTGGICTQFCKVGDANNTCPTGTECDAELPATGMYAFTKEPQGMAGICSKICTQDSDCPSLPTGYCYASAGHTNKTCQFGPPPT